MIVEKRMIVAAPINRVWEVLLDPKLMAGCVPGTESVEVLSETEYLAVIKVKISFISARFKVRTTIVETRPPNYLRCEGTGEDSAVASSMKQTSELFLSDQGDGTTEISVKGKADILGRLGTFGLSVMKTKVDRMWIEFGDNLKAILTPIEAQTSNASSPSDRLAR
jgi:carbon monoxide dehydrogenase subunit G